MHDIAGWQRKGPLMCLVGLLLLSGYATGIADMTMKETEKVLVDFTGVGEQGQWFVVNDGVMGGLSSGKLDITADGTARFHGLLSLENNGGFSSARRRSYDYGLTGYDGVIFRVLGDGRTYQFRIRMGDRFDDIAYQAEFKARAGKWTTISIPFAQFEPTFHGRRVPGAPELQLDRIRQIGFLIADKQAGPFQLSIDWIRAYSNGNSATLE